MCARVSRFSIWITRNELDIAALLRVAVKSFFVGTSILIYLMAIAFAGVLFLIVTVASFLILTN
jgi:hypothetical protein